MPQKGAIELFHCSEYVICLQQEQKLQTKIKKLKQLFLKSSGEADKTISNAQ